jgi:signal transduction histidine kinase
MVLPMAQRTLPGDLRRPVIASSAAVVACFVLATAFAEYRTRLGGDPAIDLASVTSPRIVLLASTAVGLQDLSDAVRELEQPCAGEDCGSPAALPALFERIEDGIRAYASSESTHAPPSEPDKLVAVHDAMETALDRLRGEWQNGGSFPLRSVRALADAIGVEQRELSKAIRAEATFAGVEAQRLSRARRRRMFLVVILDSISVLMAAILTRLALRAAVARQRFNEERSDELEIFASRVAHDILNPVAAAEMSALRAIRSGKALEVSGLESLVRSLRRARFIADALLDFARAGARPSPEETTGVREATTGAIADVVAEAGILGIEIVATPIADAEVACSRGALASILGNLLTNAVRYMGASAIRRVFVRSEAAGNRVRFEVEDTGPGLPRAGEKSLFDPFVRGENASGTGVGLGLATVKRLVDAHGGSVRADVGQAGGCLVEFELPRIARARRRTVPSALHSEQNTARLP